MEQPKLCQGITQKGTRCQLPASRLPTDDPRFCHRFHQPKLPTEKPHTIQKPLSTEKQLPLLGTGEVEAICQQMINQRRYQDVVNLMRASKSHRAVCQKLLDQAFQKEICDTLNQFFTTNTDGLSLTEGGCHALNTYIIQPFIEAMKQFPPEQNDTEIGETVDYLKSVVAQPALDITISDDRLEYVIKQYMFDVNHTNNVAFGGFLLPFVRSQLPTLKQNQCLAVALIIFHVITDLMGDIIRQPPARPFDQFDLTLTLAYYRTHPSKRTLSIPRLAREKNRDRWMAILREIYTHFHPDESMSKTVLESLFQLLIMPFVTVLNNCPVSKRDQCLRKIFDLHESTFHLQDRLLTDVVLCLSNDIGSLKGNVLPYLANILESVMQTPLKTEKTVLEAMKVNAPRLLETL